LHFAIFIFQCLVKIPPIFEQIHVYGPLQERTLRNGLIKKLIEGYGYSDKLEIAKRLVDEFLDTIDQFSPPVDRVKTGQMVWIARSDKDKQGYGKRSEDIGF